MKKSVDARRACVTNALTMSRRKPKAVHKARRRDGTRVLFSVEPSRLAWALLQMELRGARKGERGKLVDRALVRALAPKHPKIVAKFPAEVRAKYDL